MTTPVMTTTAAARASADRRDTAAYLARAREHFHTIAGEVLCDLGERAMSRHARPRNPLSVRLVLAAGAMLGAVLGIYSH